jgi:hypothetical protein
MMEIYTSITICIACFVILLLILRRDSVSLGVPIAYLFSLLLIHVPGAYAVLVDDSVGDLSFVKTGIALTAIGSISFLVGVFAVSFFATRAPVELPVDRHRFAVFCLVTGWLFTFGLSFLRSIPSLGAVVDKGGAIWMLGVIFGLRLCLKQSNLIGTALWACALLVYPLVILVLGGFLSYGSQALIIVLSALLISVKGRVKVFVGLIVGVFLGLSLFVNYFAHRDSIRQEAWGGAALERKLDAVLEVFNSFEWISSSNRRHMFALTERLNQNYFVGLADARIENGDVNYLYGRSVWEGLISFVPRALWPDKPVFGGSPKIVSEVTGLNLDPNTSFGVGNVMEFHINFGIPGLICGFFLLGALIRTLDRRAAVAERQGDFGTTILCFLPAAVIHPGGSFVELASGSAAAWLAGIGWKWLWKEWSTIRTRPKSNVHLARPERLRSSGKADLVRMD